MSGSKLRMLKDIFHRSARKVKKRQLLRGAQSSKERIFGALSALRAIYQHEESKFREAYYALMPTAHSSDRNNLWSWPVPEEILLHIRSILQLALAMNDEELKNESAIIKVLP